MFKVTIEHADRPARAAGRERRHDPFCFPSRGRSRAYPILRDSDDLLVLQRGKINRCAAADKVEQKRLIRTRNDDRLRREQHEHGTVIGVAEQLFVPPEQRSVSAMQVIANKHDRAGKTRGIDTVSQLDDARPRKCGLAAWLAR